MESDEELIQELNISLAQLQICIEILQRFEPVGVGARSVKECLLIQLNGLECDTTIAKQVIKNYFDLFVNKNLKEISKKLKVSLPELQKEIDKKITPLIQRHAEQMNMQTAIDSPVSEEEIKQYIKEVLDDLHKK